MSTNFLVLTGVFKELMGVFGTLSITGVFVNPMYYWGFLEPHALLGVFRTPGINGGFQNPKH